MKNFILAICVLCCSLVQAKKPAFKMQVTLQSPTLPATYRVKVKLGLVYQVLDLGKIVEEKRRSPVDSDYLIREKSPQEYEFEVTYASGKPVFSKEKVLEFLLPGGVSEAPKGLYASLGFPFECETYDGPKLISKSQGRFGMKLENARTKPACLVIHESRQALGEKVEVGISLTACGTDFSKLKKIPQ